MLQIVLLHVATHDDVALANFFKQAAVGRLAGIQRMATTTVEPQGFVVQRQVRQPRHAQREVADGQVQPAVQYPLFELRRGADVDVQVGIVPA
ncbi:hypothetical protein D3C80_1940320 [compost metagenome]